MRALRYLYRRLQALWRSEDIHREIAEELSFHIALRTEDNIRRGMTPEEARREAERRFGRLSTIKEEGYDVRGGRWLETTWQDLRYSARMLARGRWATVITILSLALGIGVNAAIVTAYKAFFVRPLDARNAGEMVNIAVVRNSGLRDYTFSHSDYEAYRDSVSAFSGLVEYRPMQVRLSNAGEVISQRAAHEQSAMARLGLLTTTASNAEFAHVFVVSENYFSVLGASVLQGRTFGAANTAGAASPVPVLISENYRQRRFAGDPTIVGKTVHLNGVAVTIIGVTPRDFVGTGVSTPAFWLPVSIEPLINGDSRWLLARENRPYRLFGRLAPGGSIEQARTQIVAVADRLWTQNDLKAESNSPATRPATALVWPGSPFPLPLKDLLGVDLAVGLVMFGAAMLLVVACANVGSLRLAVARSREVELRTRLSLGATRARVVRQLLTENALVGLAACVLALLLSWALLKVVVRAIADALPVQYGTLVFDVSPNLAIFAYVLLISLIAGLLSGLSPALQSPRSALTSTGRASTTSVRTRRLQGVLVGAQVALSLVLLITGSLFVRGAVNSLAMETGYESKQVVQLDFQFPKDPKYSEDRRVVLANELRLRMAALPGVSVTTSARPPGFGFRTAAIPVDERRQTAGTGQSILNYTYVQASYFETLGIPLVRGRGFEGETGAGQFVVLSESAARRIFQDENPLGRNIRLGLVDERPHPSRELAPVGTTYQVAGIARDTRGWSFDRSASEQIYLPLATGRIADHPLLIRVQSDPLSIIRSAERAVASIDPEVIVTSWTLEDALRQSTPFIVSTLAAAISSSIGMLGLMLTLIGIFGTVSHVVAVRTREVGIRIAIGAQKEDVLRLILHEITRPVVAGLIAGMALAAGVVYLLRGMLYGITFVDGSYFVVMSLLFLIVALLAAYPPARRAMKVDPVVALRSE